jgi:Reductase C-terminal
LKLMIAGLTHGVDQWVVRGDPATRAFSTFGFRDGKLAVVESVNRAGDHAAAKRIIGTTKTLTPEEAADPCIRLAGAGEEVGGRPTVCQVSVARACVHRGAQIARAHAAFQPLLSAGWT